MALKELALKACGFYWKWLPFVHLKLAIEPFFSNFFVVNDK